MKLPFLNIWITRKDWRDAFFKTWDEDTKKRIETMNYIKTLKSELEKYKQPRNPNGTFKSKKKDVLEQLKAEIGCSNTVILGNYDAKTGKLYCRT
jgi:hypothetical protein